MSEEPPRVNFGLLGEEDYVTSFIQTDNPRMREIARKIKAADLNEAVIRCAEYTSKNIHYALDSNQKPAACRHTKVFKFFGPIYLVDTGECPYGWLTASQAFVAGHGICFDTAVFCTTLLRIKNVKAFTVLGAVLHAKSKKLIGFHAWVETFDNDDRKVIIETTSPKATILPSEAIYSGKMPYVYDPICWFNESFWHEDKAKAEHYVEFGINVLRKAQI
jgi:transglutaminase-like putative cysteine protease